MLGKLIESIKDALNPPWVLPAKIWGKAWVFVCVPFRAYARSVVYNYVLQNQKRDWLKRLWERSPEPSSDGEYWTWHDVHGVGRDGRVRYRKVSALKFYIVALLVWGWLDDDSNHDTTDLGFIDTLANGERRGHLWGRLFGRHYRKLLQNEMPTYGNAFDLGDYRAQDPFYDWRSTLAWNDRNTAMNFQYLWADY